MRAKAIGLTWFRGAAEHTALTLDSKSMVIYGENGSGKSSFVDALEYILNRGRIGHLINEYSGRYQEKAIINTHTPADRNTELYIQFRDDTKIHAKIDRNGGSTISGTESVPLSNWDYRRTVLRQDEITTFIQGTKGEKYSALLPLLGLHSMEVAAENIRQLSKAVEQQGKVREKLAQIKSINSKRQIVFGAVTDNDIEKIIEGLHVSYCDGKPAATDPLGRCKDVETALDTRFGLISDDNLRYVTLQQASTLELKKHIDAVNSANSKLAEGVEPLILEKISIVESVAIFASKLIAHDEVICPACGRAVHAELLQSHVNAEKERLEEIIQVIEIRKAAIATLCDTIRSLKESLNQPHVKSWRDNVVKAELAANLKYLDAVRPESVRQSCTGDDLVNIEANLIPLIDAASTFTKVAPPDIKQLSTDRNIIQAAREVIEAKDLLSDIERVGTLASFLGSLEKGIREEIRLLSQKVIDEISVDVRDMWAVLHPGKAIEDIRLYLPEDTDKAIDIGLKFHQVEQDSPRITLSEGYRNSLGLCIFLAMTKRDAKDDRPLFLDDVVVSLDRNHRGMIAELLEREFSTRQVVILTHDRDWYTELRQLLDEANWAFKVLKPYDSPAIGIRWSDKTSTFDDARAHLIDAPEAAGNTARTIMDIELAIRVERLKARMPYLHRERNDHRTAHDFLVRLISDAKKCFKIKRQGDTEYTSYTGAIEAWDEADKLLAAWGNRASHSFDVVRIEAERLIAVCEHALAVFHCAECNKPLYRLEDAQAEQLQCSCGSLRWGYGKI